MPPVFCKLNQPLVFFCFALDKTISGHGSRCLVAVSRRMLLHIENQAGETCRTASRSAPALLSSAPEHTAAGLLDTRHLPWSTASPSTCATRARRWANLG
jgi:hypothetical protein